MGKKSETMSMHIKSYIASNGLFKTFTIASIMLPSLILYCLFSHTSFLLFGIGVIVSFVVDLVFVFGDLI